MKHIIFLFILALAACCDKEEFSQTVIPQCIKDNYVASSNSNLIVKQWEKNGQVFYFFNTGASTIDAPEYIYNSNCEEVCIYCGECFHECWKDFPTIDSEEWVKVLPE